MPKGRFPGRIALSIALCCLVSGLSARPALAVEQFRSIWADVFHSGFKSTSQIDSMIQRAVDGNYNAIVAEVLAYQDNSGGGHGAYWNSLLVPKATDISGDIDPLAELCTRAHAVGIEVHAWLVTYRVCLSWPPSGNSIIEPEWIMTTRANMGGGPSPISGAYTLDPGSPDVQEYLVNIVQELATNYEIDGINWDYIRYTSTDGGYPADSSYYYSGLKRYQRIYDTTIVPLTSEMNWDTFRRRSITELVARCRAEIPSIRTNPRQPLRQTADTFATGYAPGDFTTSQAYNYFQDWRLWMEKGYLDATIPMNYKREHETDEAAMYRSWIDQIMIWRYNRHAYCGQGNYLNSMANSVTQMTYAYNAGANGTANYSYYATADQDMNGSWENDWSWYPYVASNLFTAPADLPTMPWRIPSQATEGTIWGRVYNFDTGDPVDNATVQVAGYPAVTTDGGGYYTITMVPAAEGGTFHSITAAYNTNSTTFPQATVFAGDVVRYDFKPSGYDAYMSVNTTPFSQIVEEGTNAPSDSFTVTALGTGARGPLNYLITDDADWIEVVPFQGSSNGEVDTITVNYNTASLAQGTYNATITVDDPEAVNSPQMIAVDIMVVGPAAPGDSDFDGDVDQADFAYLQKCFSELPGVYPYETCSIVDLDGDGTINGIDITIFVGCISGPNVLANLNCAD